MGENNFCTAQGIRIPDLSGIHCAYETWKNETGWVFTAVLDAPRIPAFLQDYCALLPVPGYFTLELPAEEDGAYDIYYVDGCTRPVLQAIARRYGNLLAEDGDVRFGFSSLGIARTNIRWRFENHSNIYCFSAADPGAS